jgi:hypothetical protein
LKPDFTPAQVYLEKVQALVQQPGKELKAGPLRSK